MLSSNIFLVVYRGVCELRKKTSRFDLIMAAYMMKHVSWIRWFIRIVSKVEALSEHLRSMLIQCQLYDMRDGAFIVVCAS